MSDMLSLTTQWPEVGFAPGDIIVAEGGTARALWVLVSGRLEVRKGNVVVNWVTQPGALVGEVSALLGTGYSATVVAVAPSVLRRVDDGPALLASDPVITRLVAVGLAERLNFVTAYLVDLKQQYGDAPGLSMVPQVLNRLAQHPAPATRPGSARDPDPSY